MPESDAHQNDKVSSRGFTGPVMMFLSAALFGYFGFSTFWNTTGLEGQFLAFVTIEEWTLKGCAIGFALAGVLSFLAARPAEYLYSIVGILSALGFVAAGVMDIGDQQHTAIQPFLLFLFAAWNGFGSLTSIRMLVRGS